MAAGAGTWVSGGANAGYAISPARDLVPRIFGFLAGWGQVALPGVNGYFWVPIVGAARRRRGRGRVL